MTASVWQDITVGLAVLAAFAWLVRRRLRMRARPTPYCGDCPACDAAAPARPAPRVPPAPPVIPLSDLTRRDR